MYLVCEASNVNYVNPLYREFRAACMFLGFDLYYYEDEIHSGPATICTLDQFDAISAVFAGTLDCHNHAPEHLIAYPISFEFSFYDDD